MINVADLLVTLRADTRAFELGMAGAANTIRASEKRLADFTLVAQRLGTAGKALTIGVTLPLVALGTYAVKAAMDLESGFTGVRKTIKATEEELVVLRKGFDDMARRIPVSTKELYAIGQAAGQLGIETKNILYFTEVMAMLGTSTNIASTEAASSLARFMNIMGTTQTDVDRLGATIVDLGNNFATTEAEIVEMALRLAGAGKVVGLTEAQVLGLATALSSVGMDAQAGGSSVSRAMINMASAVAEGGDKVELFAAIARVSVGEFSRLFKEDAAQATILFVEGLGQLVKQGGNAFGVLEQLGLGETRVRDALLRGANAGDLFRRAMELGTAAWSENLALVREAELRYGTTASKVQMVKNRVQLLAASFGEILIPEITRFLDNSVIPFIARLQVMDDKTKGLYIRIAVFAAMIGPVGLALNGLMKTLATFSVVATGTTAALGRLAFVLPGVSAGLFTVGAAVNFVLGPVGWAIIAITGLILAGKFLIAHWDDIRRAALNTWGTVKLAFYSITGAKEAADRERDIILERNALAEESAKKLREQGEKRVTAEEQIAKAILDIETKLQDTMVDVNADATKDKIDYLENFERDFSRIQQGVLRDYRRSEEDATEVYRRELDRRRQVFEDALDAEKLIYRRTQEDMLDAFRDRQRQELDALRERHQAEKDALDAEIDGQIKALRAQQDAIKAAEKAEQRAKAQLQMAERVTEAEEDLAAARAAGDQEKVADAEKALAEVRREQAEMLVAEQRRAEIERIDTIIDALRAERDLRRAAMETAQAEQQDQLTARHAADLKAYQREQEDARDAEEKKWRVRSEEFERGLAEEQKRWEQAREDQLERYQWELEDLKESFKGKLKEQEQFLADWNAAAARMRAMVPAVTPTAYGFPSVPTASVTAPATTSVTSPAAEAARATAGTAEWIHWFRNVVEEAKHLAAQDRLDAAAQLLHSAVPELPLDRARQNLREMMGLPEMREGGIVGPFKPTAFIAGEGPEKEVIAPLSDLMRLRGGSTVTININNPSIASDYDVERIGELLVRRMRLGGIKR